ncbi:hypothetical protein SAMN04515647_1597 [Cohaesibacter sp. ES.047]|uniref:hypothetical protein n=1 Tax=Cohaesibacter sp. ES.047 TaxID=1798205 RepID=UPI000BB94C07|nr:hypothetical protein [Cohaesibacter sp. ES.047]SNY91375.1 hypothetical protein SAMN04515647_1597 [Cohaesibacter sp. ES.047]
MSSSLPIVLQEIADITGDAMDAIELAQNYGGSRVQIPAYVQPEGHWLTDLVGLKKAKQICDFYRVITPEGRSIGYYMDVPLGLKSRHEIIRKRIDSLLAEGRSHDVIAREVGVSRLTVLRRSKEKPPDRGQMDLFSH